MSITVVEEDAARLADYARVPIAFTVGERFDAVAIARLLRGEAAEPSREATSHRKDYDAHPGNHPGEWPSQFDVSRWTIFGAYRDGRRAGGAVLIRADPAIDLLRDCPDCGLLWDIRVAPEMRSHGIGSALMAMVLRAAVDEGLRSLRVETQQINVPACRFYQRHGFRLERAARHVYESFPDEIQLIWRKAL